MRNPTQKGTVTLCLKSSLIIGLIEPLPSRITVLLDVGGNRNLVPNFETPNYHQPPVL